MTHCTNPLHPAERMYKPDAGQQYAHQLQHVWTTIVRTKKKLNNRNVQEYHTDEINTYLSSCHYDSKCESLKCSNGVGYEELTSQTTWNNTECKSQSKRISCLWYSNKKNNIVFYVGVGEESSKNWHYFADTFFHSIGNFTMSIHQFISSPFTMLTPLHLSIYTQLDLPSHGHLERRSKQ